MSCFAKKLGLTEHTWLTHVVASKKRQNESLFLVLPETYTITLKTQRILGENKKVFLWEILRGSYGKVKPTYNARWDHICYTSDLEERRRAYFTIWLLGPNWGHGQMTTLIKLLLGDVRLLLLLDNVLRP